MDLLVSINDTNLLSSMKSEDLQGIILNPSTPWIRSPVPMEFKNDPNREKGIREDIARRVSVSFQRQIPNPAFPKHIQTFEYRSSNVSGDEKMLWIVTRTSDKELALNPEILQQWQRIFNALSNSHLVPEPPAYAFSGIYEDRKNPSQPKRYNVQVSLIAQKWYENANLHELGYSQFKKYMKIPVKGLQQVAYLLTVQQLVDMINGLRFFQKARILYGSLNPYLIQFDSKRQFSGFFNIHSENTQLFPKVPKVSVSKPSLVQEPKDSKDSKERVEISGGMSIQKGLERGLERGLDRSLGRARKHKSKKSTRSGGTSGTSETPGTPGTSVTVKVNPTEMTHNPMIKKTVENKSSQKASKEATSGTELKQKQIPITSCQVTIDRNRWSESTAYYDLISLQYFLLTTPTFLWSGDLKDLMQDENRIYTSKKIQLFEGFSSDIIPKSVLNQLTLSCGSWDFIARAALHNTHEFVMQYVCGLNYFVDTQRAIPPLVGAEFNPLLIVRPGPRVFSLAQILWFNDTNPRTQETNPDLFVTFYDPAHLEKITKIMNSPSKESDSKQEKEDIPNPTFESALGFNLVQDDQINIATYLDQLIPGKAFDSSFESKTYGNSEVSESVPLNFYLKAARLDLKNEIFGHLTTPNVSKGNENRLVPNPQQTKTNYLLSEKLTLMLVPPQLDAFHVSQLMKTFQHADYVQPLPISMVPGLAMYAFYFGSLFQNAMKTSLSKPTIDILLNVNEPNPLLMMNRLLIYIDYEWTVIAIVSMSPPRGSNLRQPYVVWDTTLPVGWTTLFPEESKIRNWIDRDSKDLKDSPKANALWEPILQTVKRMIQLPEYRNTIQSIGLFEYGTEQLKIQLVELLQSMDDWVMASSQNVNMELSTQLTKRNQTLKPQSNQIRKPSQIPIQMIPVYALKIKSSTQEFQSVYTKVELPQYILMDSNQKDTDYYLISMVGWIILQINIQLGRIREVGTL